MTPDGIMEFARVGIFTMLKISLPILLVSLSVGLVISLFQALTQVQEMTLTFVPKIVAIFVTLLLLMPFIGGQLANFTQYMFNLIGQS